MAHALRSRLNPFYRDFLLKCQAMKRCSVNIQQRTYAKEVLEEDEDRPVKYTTSRARAISAKDFREEVVRDDSPWAQTISLMTSLAAFLIYFGYLREPNDIDDLISYDVPVSMPEVALVHKQLQERSARDRARRSFVG